MASSKCKAESATKKFCSIRANPKCGDCKQAKNYIDACKPAGWANYSYPQMVSGSPTKKKYEAHHILCVSPVTDEIAGKSAIKAAIEETDWCINNPDNMVAMPLWGHTVQWYCRILRSKKYTITDAPAPPFANIPQHNFDHNSKGGYTHEIRVECKNLAAEVKNSGHSLKGDALKGKLDKLSAHWRKQIAKRGAREDGTHAAGQAGQKDPDSVAWCKPFSMASNGKVSSTGFPVRNFDDKVADWVDRIARAIANGE